MSPNISKTGHTLIVRIRSFTVSFAFQNANADAHGADTPDRMRRNTAYGLNALVMNIDQSLLPHQQQRGQNGNLLIEVIGGMYHTQNLSMRVMKPVKNTPQPRSRRCGRRWSE